MTGPSNFGHGDAKRLRYNRVSSAIVKNPRNAIRRIQGVDRHISGSCLENFQNCAYASIDPGNLGRQIWDGLSALHVPLAQIAS
jgi:hypothetical protein